MCITNYFDLTDHIGKKVKITGKKAKAIWQHLTKLVDTHPFMTYFDLEDGHQTVIYSKEDITWEEKLEVTGTVIKVEGQHKNPRSKIQDKFSEYHIVVESWNAVK